MLFNTMFDVAFSLEHEGNPEDVPVENILNALQKRINFLRANPQEAADAFGINDSYEIESVKCHLCGKDCDSKTVHLHQDDFIGDCCWDERLRSSE